MYKRQATKGYVALFICFSTKAVHLEAVSDLTSEAFIAALRRFSARRGAPRHIFSDNGTNFVGANRKLKEMQTWNSLPNSEQVSHYLTQSCIDWHFIPPASPHFGGIWEAGIRSVKFHLKRVMGDSLLTFEELSTLLTQIESLLNSRPLFHVNQTDTDSINILTPSHFLTGDVLTTVPDSPDPSYTKGRWSMVQTMRRGFWKTWSRSYLPSLQERRRWQATTPNIKIDDVVVIRDPSIPGKWPLGRVIQTHPGSDGLVRIVTLKTKTGLVKRPITKIVPLPLYQD